MPELPEVETMRRGILPARGCTVEAARLSGCRKRPLKITPAWSTIQRRIKNRRIQEITRHGKRLQIHFAHGDTMVVEPRMTGLMLTEDPPTREHLRFELKLSGGDCDRIRFWDRRGLAHIHLMNQGQLTEFFAPQRVGPDALTIDAAQLKANLCRRSIPIKVGLLDQKAVAGVGNIYASEILHWAGVNPRTKCQRISQKSWQRIHRYLLAVLQQAIEMEGSTLSDGTYRNALNDPGSYQNHHRVYDRAGQRCPGCNTGRIKRIVQSQRSTYYCPHCQR